MVVSIMIMLCYCKHDAHYSYCTRSKLQHYANRGERPPPAIKLVDDEPKLNDKEQILQTKTLVKSKRKNTKKGKRRR